ncbi:MAG: AraC family transcriptional regulator, partial [Clostridiales bacterium]|nr:AraC family transcriptional regulator [Clostridiales bacterium]
LQVLPEFAMQYCTYNINLLPNFRLQSGNTIHKINLSNEQFKILHSKFKRYEEIKGIYGEEMLKRLCVIEILIYVSGFFKNNAPNSEHVSGECVTNILPIIHFINENITEDLCLDMIASEVHMNKSYLCKLFNKCTGTTINSYISKKRITKAKTLLLQNIPATEVSLDVGFNDYSTFSRAFKEDVGCSPSFYLKYLAESKK